MPATRDQTTAPAPVQRREAEATTAASGGSAPQARSAWTNYVQGLSGGRGGAGVVQARAASSGAMAGSTSAGAKVVQRKATKDKLPEGNEAFGEMWGNHPHNYQSDESQNTDSETVLEENGLPSGYNTCAIRLSIMFNKMGLTITPQKTAAAGIKRRPTYVKKTKQHYILAASEMWQYVAKNFRKADVIFPKQATYKDAAAFQTAYDAEIKPLIAGKKGIVAFEKIFGYGGTGHVDLFDGETLSDAPNWYPCTKVHLWYIAVS